MMPIPEQIQPLPKSLLRDQVYETLHRWIVIGVLKPGEALKDAQLASRLGISRTPVREALQRLHDEGLVVTLANKWTRVAEIEIEAVDRLLPIIQCLEELALSLAFPALRSQDLQAMEGANRRLKEALLVGDFYQAAEANRNFHNLFIQRSQNPELTRMAQGIRLKIQRLGSFYFGSSTLMPSASIDEHAELIVAIRNGDESKSLAILDRHWDNVAARLREAAQKNRPAGSNG